MTFKNHGLNFAIWRGCWCWRRSTPPHLPLPDHISFWPCPLLIQNSNKYSNTLQQIRRARPGGPEHQAGCGTAAVVFNSAWPTSPSPYSTTTSAKSQVRPPAPVQFHWLLVRSVTSGVHPVLQQCAGTANLPGDIVCPRLGSGPLDNPVICQWPACAAKGT